VDPLGEQFLPDAGRAFDQDRAVVLAVLFRADDALAHDAAAVLDVRKQILGRKTRAHDLFTDLVLEFLQRSHFLENQNGTAVDLLNPDRHIADGHVPAVDEHQFFDYGFLFAVYFQEVIQLGHRADAFADQVILVQIQDLFGHQVAGDDIFVFIRCDEAVVHAVHQGRVAFVEFTFLFLPFQDGLGIIDRHLHRFIAARDDLARIAEFLAVLRHDRIPDEGMDALLHEILDVWLDFFIILELMDMDMIVIQVGQHFVGLDHVVVAHDRDVVLRLHDRPDAVFDVEDRQFQFQHDRMQLAFQQLIGPAPGDDDRRAFIYGPLRHDQPVIQVPFQHIHVRYLIFCYHSVHGIRQFPVGADKHNFRHPYCLLS